MQCNYAHIDLDERAICSGCDPAVRRRARTGATSGQHLSAALFYPARRVFVTLPV